MSASQSICSKLKSVCYTYPAIDNHAHSLLKSEHRDDLHFEGVISEAEGDVLIEDAPHTLACMRATHELAQLYEHPDPANATWEEVKALRLKIDYKKLCRICFEPSNIQCLLLDDLFGGQDLPAETSWHDCLTSSPTKRILRVETVAQDLIIRSLSYQSLTHGDLDQQFFDAFNASLFDALTDASEDTNVVGFKSIVAYRTGLDVAVTGGTHQIFDALKQAVKVYESTKVLRIEQKPLNDHIVRIALFVAATCGKPIQFHTGLGDPTLVLTKASPAHLQPVIDAFPTTKFVLLHASYPYTRDAGYLAAMYKNVWLDLGEVWPFVSGEGQKALVSQAFELCPTNKIIWSTDGHWWPETFYLGSMQSRKAFYEVLSETVRREEITETQAIKIVQDVLFYNSYRLYNLGLKPHSESA